jgi:dipeptidyl aminopeptidase/acylaminoacyl peptidase
VNPIEVPFGQWTSPISATSAAAAVVSVDEVRFADNELYWLESRPTEGSRIALVRWSETASASEISPLGADVRSDVYGYGGGVYAAGLESVWFCRQPGGQIWRSSAGAPAMPVALPAPGGPGSARYADMQLFPGEQRLVCVRERDEAGSTITDIIAACHDGSVDVLVSGADFHAHPRLDRSGKRLAWVSWSDPLLPWDGTSVWTAQVGDSAQVRVAGGSAESVLQPEWGPDGDLYFLSDRSGWWNLYRSHAGQVGPVIAADVDMAVPPWELGYSTYALLPAGRIAVLLQDGPFSRLAIHDPITGTLEKTNLPYTSIKPYLAADGHRLALIGSTFTQSSTVAVLDTARGSLTEISPLPPFVDARYLSVPERIVIPTRESSTAHGLYYPPTNPDVTAPPRDRPPLIVRPHPGPTAGISARLDPTVQFFTSRGIGVLDVDYRGSSGYGRSYREALNGRWGVLDVADCVDAADHLSATGRVDPGRVAISGASAGGYTTLRALATTTRFTAGTARSAVADLAEWRCAAPRFQRHHTTGLIGPWPETAEIYAQRSILHDLDRITAPLLLVHGGRDRIAPLASIERLIAAAGSGRALLLFPEDGHSLGNEALADALRAELELYTRVWAPRDRVGLPSSMPRRRCGQEDD